MDNVIIFNITYKTELLFSNFFFICICIPVQLFSFTYQKDIIPVYVVLRALHKCTSRGNTFSRPWNNIDHTAGEIPPYRRGSNLLSANIAWTHNVSSSQFTSLKSSIFLSLRISRRIFFTSSSSTFKLLVIPWRLE